MTSFWINRLPLLALWAGISACGGGESERVSVQLGQYYWASDGFNNSTDVRTALNASGSTVHSMHCAAFYPDGYLPPAGVALPLAGLYHAGAYWIAKIDARDLPKVLAQGRFQQVTPDLEARRGAAHPCATGE